MDQMGQEGENWVDWVQWVVFVPLGRVTVGRGSCKIRKAKSMVRGTLDFVQNLIGQVVDQMGYEGENWVDWVQWVVLVPLCRVTVGRGSCKIRKAKSMVWGTLDFVQNLTGQVVDQMG